MKIMMLLALVLFSYSMLSATIINVPADQPTIQAGINVSVDGDTVLVADGIYSGELNKNLSWNGNEKHLVVKSENGPENCWINCQQSGRAFSFIETNQDSTDIIEGFTLYNGYVLAAWEFHGGGSICCDIASPIIMNNIISNNTVEEGNGGAIFLYNSNSKIIGNTIKNNSATYSRFPGVCSGGGIYIDSGSLIIKDNIIMNNHSISTDLESSASGGGIYAYSSEVFIINNLIDDNGAHSSGFCSIGGGISISYCSDSSQVINNIIIDNSAEVGSGINCNRGQILQNIIVDNSQDGLRCNWPTHTALIKHNNVWGNPINYVNCSPEIGNTSWGFNSNGTACDSCFNICEDPLFVSDSDDDYFLSQFEAGQNEQSHCVDAGSGVPNNYELENYTTRTDLICDEGIVDIGFHYLGFIPQDAENNFISKSLKYDLSNFPNPFNPETTIRFSVTQNAKSGSYGFSFVTLEIYNIKGQKIKSLECGEPLSTIADGVSYSISWNGTDDNNKPVSSGIYFYKLDVGDYQKVSKMILVK